jgi:hypothetical protein
LLELIGHKKPLFLLVLIQQDWNIGDDSHIAIQGRWAQVSLNLMLQLRKELPQRYLRVVISGPW